MSTFWIEVEGKRLLVDRKRTKQGIAVHGFFDKGELVPFSPDRLSEEEAADLFAQFEEKKQKVDHAWASNVRSDPGFKATLRKMERELSPERLAELDSDPTALRETYPKFRKRVQSPEERKEAKAREKRAEELEKEYREHGSTAVLAELSTLRGGLKNALQGKPEAKELTEDEETLSFHDQFVGDALRERAEHRRGMLRRKGKLSEEEVAELMQLNDSLPPAEADDDGE